MGNIKCMIVSNEQARRVTISHRDEKYMIVYEFRNVSTAVPCPCGRPTCNELVHVGQFALLVSASLTTCVHYSAHSDEIRCNGKA